MNNLTKHSLIKRNNLNQTYYFQSLIEEGHRLKLLSDSELENIQLQSVQLLAQRTKRFTGGESSSVKVETAQSILQSIFHSIGIYLKSFPDPDMSIVVLKEKSLAELFEQGKSLIKSQVEYAKQLFAEIQKDCLITENCAYNDTIQKGIPEFFSAFDADFAAHETPASIDYPLSDDKMDLIGIEYISNYLHKLSLENEFCKNFPGHDIHCLLRGYDDHYEDLLINIFALVLTNALGSILADKNAIQLNIQTSDREYLQHNLANLSKDALTTLLQNASQRIIKELNISNQRLQKHITATIENISTKLKHALDNNRLDSIFISLKENNSEPVYLFAESEKLQDELFRRVADEIRECRYTSDKIAIIQRELHSLTDLIDILEGYCIFDDEFTEIFKSLGDMELALLSKKLPTHIIDSDFHFTENEKVWQNWLTHYLEVIDSARRERIQELAIKIDFS